jgi:hypothetical protein
LQWFNCVFCAKYSYEVLSSTEKAERSSRKKDTDHSALAGKRAVESPTALLKSGSYAKKERLITENVVPNFGCRVKERLKTGCIVKIVGGVSTANRRCYPF